MILGCLVWAISLTGCGGGGSGGRSDPTPTPPITPRSNTVVVAGRAHAGTPARPLAQAPCRFVDQQDRQSIARATTNEVGGFEFAIPVERQGFILCHPAAIPSLTLSGFLSTLGRAEGTRIANEDVTPASSVIADVIRANNLVDPQARKVELLAELAREEADISALVDAATLVYQRLFEAGIGSDADFSGDGDDGGDEGGADGDDGGADGEAGDGGEFSPLPGALCTFSLDAAGLVRANTILADLYADGQIDRLDLQAVAATINAALDAERRSAITKAVATLFPIGTGPAIATIADGPDSATPGRYFLPTPAGVPGVVTCTPVNLDQLVLNTCLRARAPNEVLSNEDVTPVTTVVCEIANEAQQSGTTLNRDATRQDLLDRLAPLRIFLSEDRNGNGIQDPDEADKNGDGEFVTIVELETDEPLTENNRDLALLASMSTTIFDTMRIERNELSFDQSFAIARDDFFTDGFFEIPLEPIASGVEDALDDPANQAVLGTDDVITAATTGTLQGRVTDVRGRPISDVQVLVSQGDDDVPVPDNPATTDIDGRFRIGSIPVGETTVRAFLGEFEVLRVTTNVVAVVTITLEIAPTPQIRSQPSALVFGDVSVASQRVLTVALGNQGLADLTLNRLVIEGAGAAAFRFTRRPVLPVVVSAGSEVTIDISYEPTAVTSALATLRVESDAANTPVLELPLIGSGVTQPVPQMELSRTSLVFGEVEREAFRTQSMIVSNSGTAPLTIRTITIEAASGSGFSLEQVPSFPASLPPDGELRLRVRFQPSRAGASRGIVRILSDADARPSRTVALSGIGVDKPVPEIDANPRVLEFGEAQVNTPGEEDVLATQTVTLLNNGTADLTLTAIRVDSSQGNEFRLFRAPSLPITIIPGAGLILGVQYRPTILGSVTGAVRIRSDAANLDDLTISLNGTGVDTRVPKISVSTSTLDYREVEVESSRRLGVDVTNTGTGDLVITEFRLQSPAGGVFELLRPPDTPFTLVPGATQHLQVRFRPHEEGYATGTLRIFNNDVERPRRRISLQGEGVPIPIPQMRVTPDVASFGEVQVGSSRRIVITIANPCRVDLEVTTLQGSALSAGAFALRQPPRLPLTLRPNAEVDIEVVFRPSREGSVTGTLRVRGTAPETPVSTVPLHGTGVPEPSPQMQVQPQTVNFGEVQEGISRTEDVIIRNNGTADLIIRELFVTARSSRDFAIDRAPQLPVTVVPGSTAQVRIRYSPSGPGVASGALRIRGNDPDTPTSSVSLNGIGTPEPAPQINATPIALVFGELQEGRRRRQTLTVRNTGTATLVVTNLVLDGADFRLASTYDVPIRIRPQGVVRLDVLYAPTAPGSDTGTLRLENNSPETPAVIVALSGDAIPEPKPRIEVDPGSAVFSDVQIGSRRRLPIRIHNTGTAPLDVTELRVDGGPSGTFSLVDNSAPVTIVEGGSIRVEVVFAPVREGSVTGTFYVESNADNADGIRVPLSGTGLPEPVPQIAVTPAIVEFPEVQIGVPRTRTITIRNTGTDDLVVTALNIDGGDNDEFQVRSAPSLPVTVLSEGAVEVRVTYRPVATGSASGTLTVVNNDPERPSVILPLSGIGAPIPTPQVDTDTTSLAFSEVEVGRSRKLGVTFINVGNAALTIRDINVESEPEGVFSLAGLLTAAGISTEVISLAPQASLPIEVIFTPQTVGVVTGTLALISDASNSEALTVSLEGMGAEAPTPALEVSPPMVDFGPLAIGQTRNLIVGMLNAGTADLTISTLQLTAADGTSFRLVDAPDLPAVIAAGNTVTAEIRFVPNAEGSATGTFRIESDDPDNPETVVSVSAEALPEPVALIEVNPSQAGFGNVPVGESGTVTLMIANDGNSELNVTSMTVTGGPENVFRLGSGRSAPFTVAPGEVETVDVVFVPRAAGVVTATLQILSNASNTPEEIVSLNGTGTAPQLTLRPATLDFGEVPVGSNRTLSATVENTGGAALAVSDISIEGTDFVLGAGVDATTLQPNETLAFDVTYQPSAAGERVGVVRVSNNTTENPVADIPLSGTGTTPEVSISPAPVAFGNVVLEQNAALPVTITNVGRADLLITSVTAEGPAFSLSGVPTETATLSPGASLTVNLTFAPLEVGEATGSIQVISNAPNSPTNVSLTGNGTPIPVEIDVTPNALTFDPQFLGEPGELTVTIANPGTSVLSVSNVQITDGADAGFALDAPFDGPVDVRPGDEVTVLVTFTPVSLGEAFGSVAITSDADSGTVVVEMSGSGVAAPTPQIAVDPTSLDFGITPLGSEQSVDIDIQNTGDAPLTVTNIEVVEGAGAGFTLQGGFGDDQVIQPDDTVTVTVLYTPLAVGTSEGQLRISSDADDVDVALNGVAVAPRIEVTPGELGFGTVFLNETRELELTIANTGDAVLNVSDVRISDGADAGFALREPFSDLVEVAPGNELTLTVTFTPSVAGDASGEIDITSNANNDPQVTVQLNGSGTEAPTIAISVSPEQIEFNDVPVNDTQTQELTLRNDGNVTLTVNEIGLTSGGDAGFAIVDGPNEAVEIVPGGSFVVRVSLTPNAEGPAEGNIQITSDADNTPTVDVSLLGTGVAQPMALIEIEPADNANFGNVEREQTRPLTVTLTNNGNADLNLDTVFISDGAEVGFAIEGGPVENEVLAPSDTLEVTLMFSPVDEGRVTGQLRVESNADNDPVLDLPLRGTGTAIPVPVATVTPGQIDLGEVELGNQATADVRIDNTGDADLTVEAVLIAEGAGSGFSVTGTPGDPVVLAPGDGLTVTVVYEPQGTGPVTATLSVLSDASNGAEQLVALQGTGIETAAPGIGVDPQNLGFGEVPLGQDAALNFTVRNPGDAVLELTVVLESSADDGVFTLSNAPTEIEASGEASVRVTFSPSSVGDASATVRITSNAEPGDITVDVTGTGVGIPAITVTPSSIDFGNVRLGDTPTDTVRIENTGSGILTLGTATINGNASFTLETAASGATIAPGNALTLTIAYQPSEVGESVATLDISSDASNEANSSVDLSGNGIPVPEPEMSVSPNSVNLGNVEIGDTQTDDITIENTGNAPLNLTEIVLTGDSNNDFELSTRTEVLNHFLGNVP